MLDGLNSVVYIFADDTKLLNFRHDRSSLFHQSDLEVFEKWSSENRTFFNIDNCHCI